MNAHNSIKCNLPFAVFAATVALAMPFQAVAEHSSIGDYCEADSSYNFYAPLTSHSATAYSHMGWEGTFCGEFANTAPGNEPGYFVMDALPTATLFLTEDGWDYYYDDEPRRRVALSFDLILRGNWYGDTPGQESVLSVYGSAWNYEHEVFRASFNTVGGTQSFPGEGALYYVPGVESAYHIDLIFPMYGTGAGGGNDWSFLFAKSGGNLEGTWGIDNVSIDWSHHLPIPPAAMLFGSGLLVLSLLRRRK